MGEPYGPAQPLTKSSLQMRLSAIAALVPERKGRKKFWEFSFLQICRNGCIFMTCTTLEKRKEHEIAIFVVPTASAQR